MAAGKLYVVGTPIGNRGDLSPRARETFAAADAVLCEDTRVTGKLLAYAGVRKPLVRCDENVIAQRAQGLVERMRAGEVFAFASDAGMPGVSDPGQVLVDAARAADVAVEVIPGPTACITALVSSGIACDHFFFEGFLPRKAPARARRLAELAPVPGALLLYESPHRVADTLDALAEAFPAREMVLRAPAPELARMVRERGELKGEMVVVVAPPDEEELARRRAPWAQAEDGEGDAGADPDAALAAAIRQALAEGEAASSAAKRLSQRFSRKRRDVYALILAMAEEAEAGAGQA